MNSAQTSGENPWPNMYEIYNQRLSRHGKPLYVLIREAASALPQPPASVEELEHVTAGLIGSWDPSPAACVFPQTILGVEHMAMLNEQLASRGLEVAQQLEARLHRSIGNLLAKYLDLPLNIPEKSKLLSAAEVMPATAYSALEQRTLMHGFTVYNAVLDWLASQRATILAQNLASDMAFPRLAMSFVGSWPTQPNSPSQFQQIVGALLSEVASSRSRDHATVIHTTLVSTLTRTIRRVVSSWQASAPAEPDPSAPVSAPEPSPVQAQ